MPHVSRDPILYDFPMPLRGHYYPLGFPLCIETNSEEVLMAALESWSPFTRRFDKPYLRLRVGVTDSISTELPKPTVRAQGHLISFIGSAEAYSIGDLESGFGYSILPEHALRGGLYFFHRLRIKGHRLTRSLALAMAQADYPRKLTESIASFLQTTLTES